MKKAIYPGSFDPITFGHIDIAERALNIFDKLYIAIGKNDSKKPLFSSLERKELIEKVFSGKDNVEVVIFDGMLVDLARYLDTFTIVRGLRAVSDFDFEFQLSSMNKKMCPEIDAVFLMTSEQNLFLSSSMVREIASMRGNVSAFVPDCIADALKSKFVK